MAEFSLPFRTPTPDLPDVRSLEPCGILRRGVFLKCILIQCVLGLNGVCSQKIN